METESRVSASEMREKSSLTEKFMRCPQNIPISFLLGGEKIAGIPNSWKIRREQKRIGPQIRQILVAGTGETGLTIETEFTEYLDKPVIEWVARIKNNGNGATPALSHILAADGKLPCPDPLLYHSSGDFCSAEGYVPRYSTVSPGETREFSSRGGRPCDGVLPYFRILSGNTGYSLAVGWPGQWHCEFSGVPGGICIKCGQEDTDMVLYPGEKIRTPKMTLLVWKGNESRSVNLWRQWYLAHVLPAAGGRPVRPMLSCSGTDEGEEYTAATEKNQLEFIDAFRRKKIDFDVWWIDAGWYPCADSRNVRHWDITGTWKPDPERFPAGFAKISEKVGETGGKLLLWFEPERVTKGSELYREHPKWILTVPRNDRDHLLNIGIPDCRRWLTERICRLIRENGIGIYRQDFNIEPLPYWRGNDPPDRRGMTENKYIQGYLRFLDDILAANPGLILDSCASGGRRNDLETMRRAVPLHYSDYGYGDHAVKLAFHHTLFAWLPYFKDVDLSYDLLGPKESKRYAKKIDRFGFHCGMAPMLSLGLDIRRGDYEYDAVPELIRIWRKAAPYILCGDYYPLTPFSSRDDRWVSWQFHNQKDGDGFVQGFRHANCPENSLTVFLQGLYPECRYVFTNPETQENILLNGSLLIRDGFSFTIPKRSASIWFYRVRN